MKKYNEPKLVVMLLQNGNDVILASLAEGEDGENGFHSDIFSEVGV